MVISIIALLISILLPALQKARDVAQSIQCVSNQRQIGVAMAAYQADYKGYFPPWEPVPEVDGAWSTMLWQGRYVSTPEVYLDPAAPAQRTYYLEIKRTQNERYALHYISYGYNWMHVGSSFRYSPYDNSVYAQGPPARMSELIDSHQVIIALDTYRRNFMSLGNYAGANACSDYSTNYERPDPRHNDAINVLWGDGHASTMAISNTANPYDSGDLGQSTAKDSLWTRD